MTAVQPLNQDTSPVIARFSGRLPGPTLIIIGGVHGNEPAGVQAAERVVEQLQTTHEVFRGDVIFLKGNVPALTAGRRFIDRDLNRRWGPTLAADSASVEDNLQENLQAELHSAFDRARGTVWVLDLHTMSGPGLPFAVFADTIRCRRFAQAFGVPLLLGIDEHLDGTLVDYLAHLGHRAVLIEGGQHDDPESVDRLHAAAWIAIGHCRLLANHRDTEVLAARAKLKALSQSLPPALEITYRHAVSPNDDFEMQIGFSTFDQVEQGQLVATDADGKVKAQRDGYLLLPLYQRQGDDGYFLAQPIHKFWLRVSYLLRLLRFGHVAHWLPGVRRDPNHHSDLLVNLKVARWGALEILHLLGYRKLEDDGVTLRVRRRRHDLP